EVLPACAAYGMGFIPYSPLASGALGGSGRKSGSAGRRTGQWAQAEMKKSGSKLEAFEKLCAERGLEPANLALGWLLANPVVTAPIIGPRTVEQLEGALEAVELTLDRDLLAKLDAIFPGPGKPAPEAYAW